MSLRRALLACVCALFALSASPDRAAADPIPAPDEQITVPPEEPAEPAEHPPPEEPPPVGEPPPPPTPHDFTRTGWYLQAQWAYALPNFGGTLDFENANGGNAAAGYRFHRLGAMDFEFEYIDQFTTATTQQVNSTGNVSLNGRLYPLGTLFEPGSIFARFQPFLKAGVAWMWVSQKDVPSKEDNEGAVAGRFGGGMDFYLNNHAVITLYSNFMLPNTRIENRQYITVGAGFQWRFGSPE